MNRWLVVAGDAEPATLPMTKLLLFICALPIFVAPVAAQTHFYLEDTFKRPAKIPDSLLPLLRAEIKSRCRHDATFQATDVRALFVASTITVNHRSALILKSDHNCLTGADNVWFWVFLRTQGRYRKILFAGSLSVDVLPNKTHGLRNIETSVATAAVAFDEIYKFNGYVYKARICTETDLGKKNAKPQRVPCQP